MIPSGSEKNEFDEAHSAEALDQLLRDSKWAEPDPRAVARLEASWQELLSSKPLVRTHSAYVRYCQVAAAALLLISTTFVVWWIVGSVENREVLVAERPVGIREGDRGPIVKKDGRNQGVAEGGTLASHLQVAKSQSTPPPTVEVQNADDSTSTELQQTADVPSRWSRPPTAYERLVFSTAARTKSRDVASQSSPVDPRLAAVLDQVASATDFELAQLSQPLRKEAPRYERLLLREACKANSTRQLSAVRLLAQLGGRDSVVWLIELSREPRLRQASVDALQKILPPEALGRLAIEETNPEIQLAFCRALVATGSRESVAVYLGILGFPTVSDAALAALDTLANPPVDPFFDFLVGEDREQRQLAAQALGRINGPVTARRLLDTANESAHAQDAILALMLCRGPKAARLVAIAQNRIPLRGAFNGALMQRQLLMH